MRLCSAVFLLCLPLTAFAQRPPGTGSSPSSPPKAPSTASPTPSPSHASPTPSSSAPSRAPSAPPSSSHNSAPSAHSGPNSSRPASSATQSKPPSKSAETSTERVATEKKRIPSSTKQDPRRSETNPAHPCKKEPCSNVAPQCPSGQQWNGALCVPQQQTALDCSAGQAWNGSKCENCATAQAANLAAEVRMAKLEMETACKQSPSGQQCQAATLSHEGALQRYRMQYDYAPVGCRAAMPDPLIL